MRADQAYLASRRAAPRGVRGVSAKARAGNIKDPQQQLCLRLWNPTRATELDVPEAGAILGRLMTDVGLKVRSLPACVVEDRPAQTAEELAVVTDYLSRLSEVRRRYLSTAGAVFALDALGVALATGRPAAEARLLRGPDFEELQRKAYQDSGWRDRPENCYWNPHRIGQPFRDPLDHQFASALIEDGLFRARDRVRARAIRDEGNRAFFADDLPQLQVSFVTLKKWMLTHTKKRGIMPMERLEDSLSGIVSETAAFFLYGINAWFDAVLLKLPSQTQTNQLPALRSALAAPGALDESVRANFVQLFIAPASLKAEEHGAMMDLEPGNGNPYKPDLVDAQWRPGVGRTPPALVTHWNVSHLGFEMPLTEPTNDCGGPTEFRGYDARLAAIARLAAPLLPQAATGSTKISSIAAMTLLVSRLVPMVEPRYNALAPWFPRRVWGIPTYAWGGSSQFSAEHRPAPSTTSSERIPLTPLYRDSPRGYEGVYLRDENSAGVSLWSSDIIAHLEEEWWQPPWLKRIVRQGRRGGGADLHQLSQALRRQAREGKELPRTYGVYHLLDWPLGQVTFQRSSGNSNDCVISAWRFPKTSSEVMDRALLKVMSNFDRSRDRRLYVATPSGDLELNRLLEGSARRFQRQGLEEGWHWRVVT